MKVQVYDHIACIVEIRKSAVSLSQCNRLLRTLVDTHNHGVVTLEGLEGKLLLGLDAHLS